MIQSQFNRFGPRFFGLGNCYDLTLRKAARAAAAATLSGSNTKLREGVYALVGGPNFESPAELRMMGGACGVDAVGMSTVYEAITARHCGIRQA